MCVLIHSQASKRRLLALPRAYLAATANHSQRASFDAASYRLEISKPRQSHRVGQTETNSSAHNIPIGEFPL